jgi:hypothetical protein
LDVPDGHNQVWQTWDREGNRILPVPDENASISSHKTRIFSRLKKSLPHSLPALRIANIESCALKLRLAALVQPDYDACWKEIGG